MLSVIQRSPQTFAHYSSEAVRLITQFQNENTDADPRRLPIVQTAEWYLGSHGRWSEGTIRIYALALEQEMKSLLEYDTFDPDSREGQILERLKRDRPASIKKAKQLKKEELAAHYSSEVAGLMEQFQHEHPDADPRKLPILHAAEWFLNSPGRWTAEPVKVYALALKQEIEGLLEFDSFDPDSPEGQILHRLECAPPAPLKRAKTKKARAVAHQKKVVARKKNAATVKKRKKRRKSLPMKELRELVRYFRSRDDEFSHWIVGYIIFASRLGWRPGEIINLQREGDLIRAAAEKHTNNRGLADTCEVNIGAYIEKAHLITSNSLALEIDRWIGNARKWEAYYGGKKKLLSNINSRLATASKGCKIRRVCTYTFRHLAISCMKASKFTRAEIAVIINHASDRTASEHYGKRQHGVKRPKKILRFNELRLPLVRNLAREFKRPSVPEKKSAANAHAPFGQEALIMEAETAWRPSF
ncbi:hypothetical protein GPL17_27725 [Bradyrhizobium yuanmingense]|uniref:hypothetical protein n=1 Tax=Bradyrhizobium yuanmingense TaxID=108015 RepID=UPI0012F7BE9D|nr:hypothetical protein [Bradyrhizobium yuanmingense]MVT54250.1 hypothetical protein [Bradyrhizobium yuanmingense]